MLNTRALLLASTIGTILQVAMVVAGHYDRSVAGLFAVGGMGLSLVAGVLYAMWASGDSTKSIVVVFRSGFVAVALISVLSGSAAAQDAGPVTSEGIIAAPIDSVWAAWTTSNGLRAWLAPHAEIDLRVGGSMRTNYHRTGTLGDSNTIDNQVLSFEPGRMLSIRVTNAPKDFPFPNAIRQMWTVLYLEEAGPDCTRLRVVSLGFRPDDESQRMRAFFERGNAMTVQALQRHFQTR